MRRKHGHSEASGALIVAIVALASTAFCAAKLNPTETSTPKVQKNQARGGAIFCRLLDVKSVARMHICLAVFHQAHEADGARLGKLLRSRDGATGQFETPDGVWHSATVLRLGSCFGRGLLVFPAVEAHLIRKEEIWIRIPPHATSPKVRDP